MIVLIPLAPLFLIIYGINGLIIVFLISNFISLIYGLFIIRRKFNMKFNPISLLGIYVCSVLSVLPIYIFLIIFNLSSFLNLLIGIPIFLFFYLTFIPLLRVIHLHDIENLRIIFSGLIFWPIIKYILKYENKLILTFWKEKS